MIIIEIEIEIEIENKIMKIAQIIYDSITYSYNGNHIKENFNITS